MHLPVIKVYGTNDCVADSARVMAGRGANHRQFRSYCTQLGDCDATITRGEQQAETARVLLDVLASMPGTRVPAR
jgi:hypothetical protein